MTLFVCNQKGCEFEADALPELCPVCNNPIIDGIVKDEVKENDPFDVGYNQGVIYCSEGTAFDSPEEYSMEQTERWLSGYQFAIDENSDDSDLVGR